MRNTTWRSSLLSLAILIALTVLSIMVTLEQSDPGIPIVLEYRLPLIRG